MSKISQTLNNPDALIPAVIYARYSSHAQKDTSIEQQVADCEEYARRNNMQIVHVYPDRHLTGTTDLRPNFKQMIKDAAHAPWKYVIVWKTDRFARNRYDAANYKYKLKKHGVRVLSAKESIPEGPEGILLEALLEGTAEYYSANLSQNIKRGMRYNALECKVTGGNRPFGYKRGVDDRLEIDEAQAEIVREIFRRVVAGETYNSLVNDLNGRGILTRRKKLWNKNSFRSMLQNETYIGVYHYDDIRIEGGVPAIIEKDVFLEAQRRLKTKKNVRGRLGGNDEYMLTGKLFCGECGSPMVGISGTGRHGGKYHYYSCNGRRSGNGCSKGNVGRDWLEDQVIDAALDVVLRDDIIEWIADKIVEYQEREANGARLLSLKDELREKQTAINNVMNAIEAGIITVTTKKRLQELETDIVRIENEITLEENACVKIDRDLIIFWLESFRSGDQSSVKFRRKIIDTFVSAVWVYDDRLRIAFNYTGKNNTVEREILEELTEKEIAPDVISDAMINATLDPSTVRISSSKLHHAADVASSAAFFYLINHYAFARG